MYKKTDLKFISIFLYKNILKTIVILLFILSLISLNYNWNNKNYSSNKIIHMFEYNDMNNYIYIDDDDDFKIKEGSEIYKVEDGRIYYENITFILFITYISLFILPIIFLLIISDPSGRFKLNDIYKEYLVNNIRLNKEDGYNIFHINSKLILKTKEDYPYFLIKDKISLYIKNNNLMEYYEPLSEIREKRFNKILKKKK